MSIIGNLPSVNRSCLDLKRIQSGVTFLTASLTFDRLNQSWWWYFRDMRVNTDLRSDICLDPIISIRSDPRPLTLEVICLHGAVIYQQGREIALPITHSTGAPLRCIDLMLCALRWTVPKKFDQIGKQDRWKTLTKRAMSATVCSSAVDPIPASSCRKKACDLQIDTDRAVQQCQLLCSYTHSSCLESLYLFSLYGELSASVDGGVR